MQQRVRIGAYGVTADRDRILLTQLSRRAVEPGRWTLPGGGMEFGETPQEALEREFYEETGLTPTIGSVLDVLSFVPRPDLHVIQMIFEVEASGEPEVIEVDGSTVDARWVPIHDVSDLATVLLVDHVSRLRGW